MNQAETHIRVNNLVKTFGSFTALRGVTLDIPRGSFTTLLGPSGCGKTTLLRLIAGFDEPDSGNILIDGKRVNDLPAFRRNTPLVFQEYALFPHMTVYENIAYGLKLQKMPQADIRRKVGGMLDMFGLQGLERRQPRELSGGQQQRVAFARALVTGHDILLLDEPLSNLDAKMRVEVRGELRELQRRSGITAVFVTHDQEEALALSDRIAVFHKGQICQAGTPWEVYFKPENTFVADFIGTANLLQGEVMGAEGEDLVIRSGDALLRVNGGGRPFKAGGQVTMMLRPEAISIAAEDGHGDGGDEQTGWEGEVVSSSFLGRMVRYEVRCGSRTLLVDDSDPVRKGILQGRVILRPDPFQIHLLPEEQDDRQ